LTGAQDKSKQDLKAHSRQDQPHDSGGSHGGESGHDKAPSGHHKAHSGHGSQGDHGGHRDHHAHMVADFKKRFYISLAITVPVLFLSPMIQSFPGLGELGFAGDQYVLFALSTTIFFYGGWPFLKGIFDGIVKRPKTDIIANQ
jgi:Cu2+-exporting ATPase